MDERMIPHKPFTTFLYTADDRANKDTAVELLTCDPAFTPNFRIYDFNRDELVNWGFRMAAGLLTRVHNRVLTTERLGKVAQYLHFGIGVLTHNEMFIPCI
jgi:hypothetical protein